MKVLGLLGLLLPLFVGEASAQARPQASAPKARILLPPGLTADSTFEVTTYGRGGDSCGKWLEGQRHLSSSSPGQVSLPSSTGEAAQLLLAIHHEAFVMGYITAASDPVTVLNVLNRVVEEHGNSVMLPSSNLLRSTDEAGVRAAVTKFCTDNPTETIMRAAQAVVVTMKR